MIVNEQDSRAVLNFSELLWSNVCSHLWVRVFASTPGLALVACIRGVVANGGVGVRTRTGGSCLARPKALWARFWVLRRRRRASRTRAARRHASLALNLRWLFRRANTLCCSKARLLFLSTHHNRRNRRKLVIDSWDRRLVSHPKVLILRGAHAVPLLVARSVRVEAPFVGRPMLLGHWVEAFVLCAYD